MADRKPGPVQPMKLIRICITDKDGNQLDADSIMVPVTVTAIGWRPLSRDNPQRTDEHTLTIRSNKSSLAGDGTQVAH